MKKLTKTRIDLNASKVESAKKTIMSAALVVAARPGGWSKLTREAVAKEAGCAEALVSRYYGTMNDFKRSIMRAAITGEHLSIVAQGLACGDRHAQKAAPELKVKAIQQLAA